MTKQYVDQYLRDYWSRQWDVHWKLMADVRLQRALSLMLANTKDGGSSEERL